MRESRAYLKFFKENLLLLLLPMLLLGSFGLYYQLRKPAVYNEGSLYEQNYEIADVNTRIALTDQIVNTLRSYNLQSSLSVPSEVTVNIYKPSPLSIKLELSSKNKDSLVQGMTSLEQYLISHYQVKEIGLKEQTLSFADFFLGFLIGCIGGFSLSLLTILLRNYFKNF